MAICENQISLVLSWDGTAEPVIESYLTFDATAGSSSQGWVILPDIDGNGTKEIVITDSGARVLWIFEATGPDTYTTDAPEGLFSTGDRHDNCAFFNTSGSGSGTLVWGYDVGDIEEIFIADHIGAEGSFTEDDFTPMRVFVDIPEEPESMVFFGEPGTLDGDNAGDFLFGMRSASAEEGEGDEDIYVVEFTGGTGVPIWHLHPTD